MAEKTTIARPYAQAVFDMASRDDQLAQWSDILELLTTVTTHPDMVNVIGNPRVTPEQTASIVLDIGGGALNERAQSLVRLLAENKRLHLLPEICGLFNAYRAEAERIVYAEVTSAFPLSDDQQAGICASLKRRLGREVELKCTTDESLIGGALIRAGDLVIDGSVTGHLDRLASVLSR